MLMKQGDGSSVSSFLLKETRGRFFCFIISAQARTLAMFGFETQDPSLCFSKQFTLCSGINTQRDISLLGNEVRERWMSFF